MQPPSVGSKPPFADCALRCQEGALDLYARGARLVTIRGPGYVGGSGFPGVGTPFWQRDIKRKTHPFGGVPEKNSDFFVSTAVVQTFQVVGSLILLKFGQIVARSRESIQGQTSSPMKALDSLFPIVNCSNFLIS